MSTIANAISVVMYIALAPAALWTVWRLLDLLLDLIPAVRDWRDFRGLDLGHPQPRPTARLHVTAERIRTPIPALPALPAGPTTTTDNPTPAEVA